MLEAGTALNGDCLDSAGASWALNCLGDLELWGGTLEHFSHNISSLIDQAQTALKI